MNEYYILCSGSENGSYATGCTCEERYIKHCKNKVKISKSDYDKLINNFPNSEYEGQSGIDKMYQKYKLNFLMDGFKGNYFISIANTY